MVTVLIDSYIGCDRRGPESAYATKRHLSEGKDLHKMQFEQQQQMFRGKTLKSPHCSSILSYITKQYDLNGTPLLVPAVATASLIELHYLGKHYILE